MKTAIRIFLRNGLVLPDIVCDEFGVDINGNTVTGYEYKGAKYPRPIYIDPTEIVAVFEMEEKETRAQPCPHFTNGCGYLDEYVKKAANEPACMRGTWLLCPYSTENPTTLCPLWPFQEDNANG